MNFTTNTTNPFFNNNNNCPALNTNELFISSVIGVSLTIVYHLLSEFYKYKMGFYKELPIKEMLFDALKMAMKSNEFLIENPMRDENINQV
jgi:hypothetical protein